MKKIIIQASAIAVITFFSACGESGHKNHEKKSSDTTHSASNGEKYVCPMDTDVVSDHPTTCSKCGMDLEKVN